MIQKLPSQALGLIDTYEHLSLGNTVVQCPYFKNTKGIRAGLRVQLGKGSIDEITEEVTTKAKIHSVKLEALSADDIREFMKKEGIGIDCSGFIAQIFFTLDPNALKKIAARSFFKSPWRAIISRLRPIENISVKVLTSAQHSTKLKNWNEVKPGDIIRTRKGDHALLVTQTTRNDHSGLKEIHYAHSTGFYESTNGVRNGKILIVYPQEALSDQEWTETDNQGVNHTYQGFLDDDGTNGIYRINYLNL